MPPPANASSTDKAQVSAQVAAREWVSSHRGGSWLLVGAAFVIVCAGIKAAAPILAPTVLGAFVATINMPFVSGLQRYRVPLPLTVVLVLLADAVLLSGFTTLVVASSAQLSERLPHYFERLALASEHVSAWLGKYDMHGTLEEMLNPGEAMRFMASLAGDLVGLVGNIAVALIIAAFLLVRFGQLHDDRPGASALLRGERARRTLREVNRYVAVKTATSMATALLVGGWIWLVDGELPIVFGALAFLLNYIPSLGSFFAAIPAITLGLLVNGLPHALLLTLGYGVTNLVLGSIIEPRVMGRALGLWPLVVLLSVMVWGLLLGVTGALLSALLTVLLKMVLLATTDLRPLGLMLGPHRVAIEPELRLTADDLLEAALPQTQDSRPPSAAREKAET